MNSTNITDVTKASELYAVQKMKAELTAREDVLKEELFNLLKSQGVKSVKLEDGTVYIRGVRSTLKVKDEAKAGKWAEDNDCWKIDTGKAMKILRRELKLPKFFTKVDSEYLAIKRANDTSDDE